MGQQITAQAVRNRTFGRPPVGKRGYSEEDVDRYLRLVAGALDGRTRLSANDVHNVVFKKPPIGKRGYDEQEVDAFFDAIEDRLRARERSEGDSWAAADAAWFEAKFGRGRTVPSRVEPESPSRRVRPRAWGIGRGRWLLAAMGLTVVGLTAWFVLARPFGGSGTGHASVGSGTGHASVGSGTGGTHDPMAQLTIGECFNLSDTVDFAVVPCQQPHDHEAYYRYALPPGPFPGDPRARDAAIPICDAQLSNYVLSDSVSSGELFDWPITPDQSEWVAGDRTAICALTRMDMKKITGSVNQAD